MDSTREPERGPKGEAPAVADDEDDAEAEADADAELDEEALGVERCSWPR